jgi:hypothetical protein
MVDSNVFNYTLQNPNKTKYYEQKEILSTLSLSVWSKECEEESKKIVVSGKLPAPSCHKAFIYPSAIAVLSRPTNNNDVYNIRKHIHGHATNLDPNTDYSYRFESASASWPARILPLSGILKLKDRKNGIAYIHSLFSFCPSGINPSGFANLEYKYLVNSIFSNEDICENPDNGDKSHDIYCNLKLIIEPITSNTCYPSVATTKIVCDECMPIEKLVYGPNHTGLNLYIDTDQSPAVWDFNKSNIFQYPYPLSATNRPFAEINISGCLCDQPVPFNVRYDGVTSGEIYNYSFNTYIPGVSIIPETGTIKASGNTGIIKVSGYLNNNRSSPIDCLFVHENSKESVSDFAILRCYQPWKDNDPQTSINLDLPNLSRLED